tara:strand:+ start:14 stop:568 length:555 start_codon:yes stop_codon:yes gene_type:complete
MAYNLKDVFYLSTSTTIAATTGGAGSAQLDLSAYIDPIARGRTKGTGLAIYKAHFMMNDDAESEPVDVGEAGVMSIALLAGAGSGDVATGGLVNPNDVNATNNLLVAGASYYGPGTAGYVGDGFSNQIMPSKDVPYVIVRDNVCLTYSVKTNFAAACILSVRLECAQVTLDQATLNQLLRTQTV